MALTKKEIIELYRKRAKHYNVTANLYYLLGFREQTYREKAVKTLKLRAGDTVVEVGCGTGLNFPLLEKNVGPKGKIIGVDLTDAMLSQARRRIEENGWSNVELVQSDAALYQFPPEVDGVFSSFALTLSPEFDTVVKNGCRALKPGKRWVILDFKIPSGRLSKLASIGVLVTRPFGVTMDLAGRHPWESISKYMENTSMTEFYVGFVYISAGEKGKPGC